MVNNLLFICRDSTAMLLLVLELSVPIFIMKHANDNFLTRFMAEINLIIKTQTNSHSALKQAAHSLRSDILHAHCTHNYRPTPYAQIYCPHPCAHKYCQLATLTNTAVLICPRIPPALKVHSYTPLSLSLL